MTAKARYWMYIPAVHAHHMFRCRLACDLDCAIAPDSVMAEKIHRLHTRNRWWIIRAPLSNFTVRVLVYSFRRLAGFSLRAPPRLLPNHACHAHVESSPTRFEFSNLQTNGAAKKFESRRKSDD